MMKYINKAMKMCYSLIEKMGDNSYVKKVFIVPVRLKVLTDVVLPFLVLSYGKIIPFRFEQITDLFIIYLEVGCPNQESHPRRCIPLDMPKNLLYRSRDNTPGGYI